jgi:hypothetical protein
MGSCPGSSGPFSQERWAKVIWSASSSEAQVNNIIRCFLRIRLSAVGWFNTVLLVYCLVKHRPGRFHGSTGEPKNFPQNSVIFGKSSGQSDPCQDRQNCSSAPRSRKWFRPFRISHEHRVRDRRRVASAEHESPHRKAPDSRNGPLNQEQNREFHKAVHALSGGRCFLESGCTGAQAPTIFYGTDAVCCVG